jgi:large subunit ribosomal protein L2
MGKRLVQQARGRGGPTYRAPSFRYVGEAKYNEMRDGTAKVVDVVHCSGHTTPLARMEYNNGETGVVIAADNLRVGTEIAMGSNAAVENGNVLPLESIPEGTLIFNIEGVPGDGGKFVRCSGTFAKVLSKLKGGVIVQLPSKKKKTFNPLCRASIGACAGGGRVDKPFVKAGNHYYWMKARNKLWPLVKGVARNAIDHPFGGSSSRHKGRPTTAPKNASPGRNVGLIHARRTGRKKR